MSEHYTAIWQACRPLVDAGWLEHEEVVHYGGFGLGYKGGLTAKTIAFLHDLAADPEHRREQLTMHQFRVTRVTLHALLALWRLEPLTVKAAHTAFGPTAWTGHLRYFTLNDYLIVKRGETGRIINMTRTSKLEEFVTWYNAVEVPAA